MKLSICMMVKNEEKHLQDCLESIQPLLTQIKSELIIVDTGSTDRTIEIAKQYTNRVYFHQWQDDFSLMRNITIKYAVGEFIMILDGDEIVEDCTELIEFLKSSNRKQFNSVMIMVKNFITTEETESTLIAQPRVFRIGTIYYEGTVHNQPVYRLPGIKLVDTTLLHYGYVADDLELLEYKFQRTSKLLLKQLDEDPENVYYRYQLSVSYLMHKDFKEALAEAEMVYDKIKDDPMEIKKYVYVVGHLAKIYIAFGRYEDVIKIAEAGLAVNKEYIDLLFYTQHANSIIGNSKASIEASLNYIRLREIYSTLAISRETAIIMETLDKIQTVYFSLAMKYLDINQDDEALNYFLKLDSDFKTNEEVDLLVCEACFKTGRFKDLQKYANQLIVGNPDRIKKFIICLERNYIMAAVDKRIVFLQIFSREEGNYGALNKVRLAYAIDDPQLFAQMDDFLAQVNLNTAPDYIADIFYIMLDVGYPLADVFTYIKEENLNIYIGYLHKNYPDFMLKIKDFLTDNEDKYSYSLIRSNKILLEFLLENDSELNEEQYENYFQKYLSNGFEFLRLLYNPIIIEHELIHDMKNPEEIALLYLLKAEIYKEENALQAVEYLQKAQASYPNLERGIAVIIEDIENPDAKNQRELKKVAYKVKRYMQTMIENGQFDEAQSMLAQYKQLAADDIEIYSMEAIILMNQGLLHDAESVLKNGLHVDRNNYELLYNLGYLYTITGRYVEALTAYHLAQVNCSDNEMADRIEQNIFMIRQENIAELADYVDVRANAEYKTKVMLFGQYEELKDIQSQLDHRFTVGGLIDTSIGNKGLVIDGLEIFLPEDLQNMDYDVVIISDQLENVQAKRKILTEAGVDEKKILAYHEFNKSSVIEGFDFRLGQLLVLPQVELVTTGLSYAEVGLDMESLERDGINLALSSQDLYFDYNIMKYILGFKTVREGLKHVIINLAYYSFHYDLSKSPNEKSRVHRYYPVLNNIHHYPDAMAIKIVNSIYHKQGLNDMYEPMCDAKALTRMDDSCKVKGKQYAQHHSKMNDEDTLAENKQLFADYLKLLSAHGIKPIVVVWPVSRFYAEHYSQEAIQKFYRIIEETKQCYDFQFYDFFNTKHLGDADFWDDSHLNAEGAKKFSCLLKETIQW